MQRTLSARLPAHVGEQVRIAGWIHRRRLLKSVAFLIVRDASGSPRWSSRRRSYAPRSRR